MAFHELGALPSARFAVMATGYAPSTVSRRALLLVGHAPRTLLGVEDGALCPTPFRQGATIGMSGR
jgi:hypothetical protein